MPKGEAAGAPNGPDTRGLDEILCLMPGCPDSEYDSNWLLYTEYGVYVYIYVFGNIGNYYAVYSRSKRLLKFIYYVEYGVSNILLRIIYIDMRWLLPTPLTLERKIRVN